MFGVKYNILTLVTMVTTDDVVFGKLVCGWSMYYLECEYIQD